MILEAAPNLSSARILENGCGVGLYLGPLQPHARLVHGLEYDFERAAEAGQRFPQSPVVCAAGEHLPYAAESFEMVLSNEVIEHVQDDALALSEMSRVLKTGGRLVLFCPNRWYPVEQHGIYWGGRYIFGNIPFVNYLPNPLRNRLAPHVRAYTGHGLRRLLADLPLRVIRHTRIFGGYDNLVARFGATGVGLRVVVQHLEKTPLNRLGLSHFLVAEKI
jgi:SAM-dependent methyltransferase